MAHTAFSEIHLHIVWHTKLSMALLTPPLETFVHHQIRHRLLAEEGVLVHAIGGTENHVHVAIAIPPTVLISELIGRIKDFGLRDRYAISLDRWLGMMD